jgi:hypothetical protein
MKNWSRKRKLILCVIILLISLFFIASITVWPSPTLQMAIRRAEKQMLIGPSEIIDILDFTFSNWDHLILGETKYGHITYEYQDGLDWDNGYLRYFEKTDTATVFTTDYPYRTDDDQWLPIIAFPENDKSVSAMLTLSISGIESSKDIQLETHKKDTGYFLFTLPTDDLDTELYWLLQQAISGSWQEYVLTGTVEIQIDFFDRSGNLVDTYSKTVTK